MNMNRLTHAAAIGVLLANATGCATRSQDSGDMSQTQKGALTGAVLGGLLGAAVGGDSKGALKGALAGAAIGAIVGHYQDKQVASREEAARRYAAQANEPRLELEDAAAAPPRVPAGGTVESRVGYTVLAPGGAKDVKLTEVRTLTRGEESFPLSKRDVTRAQGTHSSVFKFTLPKDLAAGDYALITTVTSGALTKTVKTPLTVV
jgi:hypothetical protein